MAAALGPHGVPAALRFLGSCSDVPSSVAAEGLLVFSCRQSHNASASDSGSQVLPLLVAGRGELSSGIPLQVPPPSLLFTDAAVAGWGAYLLDLTAVGVWSREEKEFHLNVLEMKAVHLAFRRPPGYSGERVGHSHE